MTPPPSLRRCSITIGAAALALLLAVQTSGAQPAPPAQPAPEVAPGVSVPLLADPEDKNTRVERTTRAGAPRTASFIVTYNGFSAQAQTAFQAAVDIWATQITSAVPIRITANWTALSAGVLGQAGPTVIVRDFQGAPSSGTWYPVALANKLAGSDLSAQADIVCSFNSTFGNWYLGTNGPAPSGTYDFVSVVMHEIGHGLGFIGSMNVSGGQGSWGQGGFPYVYDRFTENNAGGDLINTSLFPNPSVALAVELQGQSGGIYWNGANGTSAAGGTRPRLFAPSPWQGGSSYSHLNEATYPAGNANSLMTPQLGQAETIHDPGAIGRAILKDMGWEIDNTTPTPTPAPGATPTPTPGSTPAPTPGATPPPKPGSGGGPTPTPSPTAAPTAAPTPTPTAAPTPAPTPIGKPGTGGGSPTPSPTPAPTPQPKATP